jgi:hypothetical protein
MVDVIPRSVWGATVPTGPAMRLPVGELWLHHSVTQLTDDPFADMRVIERVGRQRFGRFSYSWAYHARHRLLLEGAGDTVGAHTANRNSTSLGLVLIGNFDALDLTAENIADLRWSIDWLKGTNRLRAGTYPTGGHRDLKSTACPGGNAYARLGDLRQAGPAPTPDPRPTAATGGTVTVTASMPLTAIRKGSKGVDVRRLQRLFNDHAGRRLTVDGDFGPATDAATRDFQAFFGLGVDGVVGEKTWNVALLVALQP